MADPVASRLVRLRANRTARNSNPGFNVRPDMRYHIPYIRRLTPCGQRLGRPYYTAQTSLNTLALLDAPRDNGLP